ncbi:MAG: chemotaxis protein CheW [Thermodesulfobacteriota bacterium]|nr:chemotaxis protein CheW [Thermodesulfobacteriota bacterium]
MTIQDDVILKSYIEESQEHLADIESDLLAIEEAGAALEEELINKVFRAAHSVKGGAGFIGLNTIKELAHKMENVLGMIRDREIVPNPEIINVLLLASDTLRNLINNATTSDESDVSEHIEALNMIANTQLQHEDKESADKESEDESMVDIPFPEDKAVFTICKSDLTQARKKGMYVYLVQYDLINDLQEREKILLDVFVSLQNSGVILDGKVDIDAVGMLDDDVVLSRFPFMMLFASILEPDMISTLIDINEDRIYVLTEDMMVRPISQLASESAICEEQELPALEEKSVSLEPEMEKELSSLFTETDNQKDMGRNKEQMMGAVNTDASLRVNVSLLDSLMNLAGELVLGRNQLLQAVDVNDLHTIEAVGQRVDLITSELQEAIMLTRMQPIGNIFSKFPRVVRDLAKSLGKEIELTLTGKDVELDKTIIEGLSDPLTHLVRNAVDHGIELPHIRQKEGKNPVGQVILKAYHEAGHVNIVIKDDGKGLDGSKLSKTAMMKGLITEEQVIRMSDKEKINLILLPGFSTAEEVTDISGRGVGMDVVKTNLDKLGGVLDIDSTPGRGTTIWIKLPLTLAIIPSQIISNRGERYAIPQVNLNELLRIPASQVKDKIEIVGNAEVVRLRGNLLPLVRLADVLGLERTYIDPETGCEELDRREKIADRRSHKSPLCNNEFSKDEIMPYSTKAKGQNDRRLKSDRRYHTQSAVNIAVVSVGSFKYGLIVDKFHESEEIVVKPLGRYLNHCKGYAGATIMGDGRVALILDVPSIAQMARLTSLEDADRAAELASESIKARKDVQSLLVFRNAEDEQFAVSLVMVDRIKRIHVNEIEHVGGKRVIQYRGGTLPLMSIEEVAMVKPMADREYFEVIIFLLGGKEVGLLATPPVDAIEVSVEIDESTLKQPGILGSAIIGGYTTMLVDIYSLVETLNPDWFIERETFKVFNENAAIVLLAEDSNFFRNQVKGFIEDDGYRVIEAEDGMIAWNLLQQHADEISLVVTDIEMPNLDGFGLAEKIKGDQRFVHLPIIALTSLAGEENIARGREIGIDDYQIKLEKEKLLESIYGYLKKEGS